MSPEKYIPGIELRGFLGRTDRTETERPKMMDRSVGGATWMSKEYFPGCPEKDPTRESGVSLIGEHQLVLSHPWLTFAVIAVLIYLDLLSYRILALGNNRLARTDNTV